MKDSLLSEIQKKYFLDKSGFKYQEGKLVGEFSTKKPFNNEKTEHSAWIFSFIIETCTGFLICELDHRMTNNRIYGWDREGNELSTEITHKHFTPHW